MKEKLTIKLLCILTYASYVITVPVATVWALIKITKWKICGESYMGYWDGLKSLFCGLRMGNDLVNRLFLEKITLDEFDELYEETLEELEELETYEDVLEYEKEH